MKFKIIIIFVTIIIITVGVVVDIFPWVLNFQYIDFWQRTINGSFLKDWTLQEQA